MPPPNIRLRKWFARLLTDAFQKLYPPHLVVFSGPPGVGKSSLSYRLAQHTGFALLAKDQLDRTLERLGLETPPTAAYELMLDLTTLNLSNGVSVILDAVFGRQDFRHLLAAMAEQHGAEFQAVVCQCSDPLLWQQRLEARSEMVPGWTPMDWAGAMSSANRYEAWTLPHLILDAVTPFDDNFNKLLGYIVPPGN